MAGFWKRLLGRTDAGDFTAGEGGVGKTKKASRPGATGKHVRVIPSEQMTARRRREGSDADTGPWFIGKTVADIFEIRGVLGRGGMGIVYLAHDNATQRMVAVKVPLGKFVDDADARKRFAREAEAWTGLIHPCIVHAFDVRDDQTTDYRPAILMDYCDGGSLADRVHNGPPLSMKEASDIAIQVCWAMEFAHDRGHVHRDLKPSNVLLASDGKALVTDFGLVKVLEAEDLGLSADHLSGGDARLLTAVSQAGGTPEYMPPEQWEGRAEKASDIYAFGVMLYELFCGRRPFSAETRAGLRIPHLEDPPPDPRRFNDEISVVQADLMLSCLAKRPSDRPASFRHLAGELIGAYAVGAKQDRLATRYPRLKPQQRNVSRAGKEAHALALVRAGSGCRLRGDLSEADRCYAAAMEIFKRLDDRIGIASCYSNMGLLAADRGWYEKAYDLYRNSLMIMQEAGHVAGARACYTNMGVLAGFRGHYDEAMRFHRASEDICRASEDMDGLQRSLGNQALTLYYMRTDMAAALALLREQERICQVLGNKDSQQTSIGNQGLIFYAVGQHEEAMKLYQQQEKICREIGNRNSLQECLGNEALVLTAFGNLQGAMDRHREEEAICRELGNKRDLARCLGNRANILKELGHLEQAMSVYEETLAMFRELGDRDGLAISLGNKAAILTELGCLAEAMELRSQQEEVCRDLGNIEGLAFCLLGQASALIKMGRSGEAMPMVEEAHRVASEHGLVPIAQRAKSMMRCL